MAMTLVGMFDNYDDAQDVSKQIAREGIDENMIEVTSSDAVGTRTPLPKREDHSGFFARLFGMDESDEDTSNYAEAVRRGSSVVTVNLTDDSKADRVASLLEDGGAIDVKTRVEAWKAGGYKGYDPDAPAYTRDQAAKEHETLKVMQEELQVGKRTVEQGGVRVHRRISEKPVTEQVSLHQEKAVVDRRPVDRAATSEEMNAFGKNDRDIEIRETAEEAVVSKTARVVEEVSVGKESSDRTETISDTVRRSDVDVEKLDASQMQQGMDNTPPPRPQPPTR